jgi:hypothetical protein
LDAYLDLQVFPVLCVTLSLMIGGSNDKDFLRTVIKLQILATI